MGEKNLYRREGVWWLRATVRGQEVRESLRTRDVKTARKLRDLKLEEIRGARWRGEERVSWKAAVAAWGESALGQIGPNTAKRYAVSLKQCEAWLSKYDIDKIDGKVIQTLVTARRAEGATPATVRRDLTAISRVLEYAEANEWREGNPTLSKRRLLRERRDPILLPTPEAIEDVLAACSRRFAALVRAAELTGCRQAELVGARWRDFSERDGALEIIGKGVKRRTIQLSAEATAHFSAQPRTLMAPKADTPANTPRAAVSPLIFCRESGEPFKSAASDFGHRRRVAAARAKRDGRTLQLFRFHDLRHLFAVRYLRDGGGIYELSKHLGHTSVQTTEIYLAFLTPDEAARARQGTAQNTAHSQRSEKA